MRVLLNGLRTRLRLLLTSVAYFIFFAFAMVLYPIRIFIESIRQLHVRSGADAILAAPIMGLLVGFGVDRLVEPSITNEFIIVGLTIGFPIIFFLVVLSFTAAKAKLSPNEFAMLRQNTMLVSPDQDWSGDALHVWGQSFLALTLFSSIWGIYLCAFLYDLRWNFGNPELATIYEARSVMLIEIGLVLSAIALTQFRTHLIAIIWDSGDDQGNVPNPFVRDILNLNRFDEPLDRG